MASVDTEVLREATEPPAAKGRAGAEDPKRHSRPWHRPSKEHGGPSAETAPTVGVSRSEFRRGGETDEVRLAVINREVMGKHIRERFGNVQKLSESPDKYTLSVIDKLILNKGSEFVSKVDSSSELTRDELALVWTAIHDELIQKASKARMEVEEQPGKFQKLKNAPFVGSFFAKLAKEPTSRARAADIPEFTGDYLRKNAFASLSPEAMEQELNELNNLRVDIERKLGFIGSSAEDWSVPDFDAENGQYLHDSVVESMRGIMNRDHEGISYALLQREDPVRAALVRHQGMQEGLMLFSPDLAKSTLKANAPEGDTTLIQVHIDRLSNTSTEPDPIRLAGAEDKVRDATADLAEAETKLNSLPAQIQAANEAVETANGAKAQADSHYEALRPRIVAAIGVLERQNNALLVAFNEPSDPYKKAEAIREEKNSIEAKMAKNQEEINRQYQQLDRLLIARADADLAVAAANKKKRTLGTITKARKDVEAKRKDKKTAEDGLEAVATPGIEGNEDRVESLKHWKTTGSADGYAAMIDRRFKLKDDDDFGRDKLSKTDLNKDGQLRGGDAIRQHIFGLTTEGKAWYADPKNQERARLMLSDETIARGIVASLRVDLSEGAIDIGGTTYNYGELLSETATRRNAFNTAEQKLQDAIAKGKDEDIVNALRTIAENTKAALPSFEQPLLASLLPKLEHATQFQVGDMLRFLVHRGLKSAASGEPYLEISDDYAKPKADIEHTAESIIAEHRGIASFAESPDFGIPRVTWEGDLTHVQPDFFGGDWPERDESLRLHFKVEDQLDRPETNARVFVKADEQFLQFLPAQALPGMPEALREAFYTMEGGLRIKRKWEAEAPILFTPKYPDGWVPIDWWRHPEETPLTTTSDTLLERLNDDLSPEAEQSITVSTASEIMNMKPADRRKYVKAFHALPIMGVVHAEDTHGVPENYLVEFTNEGEFFITNQSDPTEREELKTFVQNRERAYREFLGVQTLSPAQRQVLQNELGQIYGGVGGRILTRQQLR